jgi:hypothetical protein
MLSRIHNNLQWQSACCCFLAGLLASYEFDFVFSDESALTPAPQYPLSTTPAGKCYELIRHNCLINRTGNKGGTATTNCAAAHTLTPACTSAHTVKVHTPHTTIKDVKPAVR